MSAYSPAVPVFPACFPAGYTVAMETTAYLKQQAEEGNADALFRLGHKKAKTMKTRYRHSRSVGLLVVWTCVTTVAVSLASPATAQTGTGAKISDTTYASPGGVYVAAVREINTGAVGSGSGILLKTRHGLFPVDGRGALAVGPPQFFGPVHWSGGRTLQVFYGASGPPDPSWKTKWRDVRVVYMKAIEGRKRKRDNTKRQHVDQELSAVPDLNLDYREMAQDKQSEAEALEWVEGALSGIDGEDEEENFLAEQ